MHLPAPHEPCVCFAQRPDGLVTIGTRDEYERAMAALWRADRRRVRLLLVLPGDADVARALRLRFAHERVDGAWHRLSPALLRFLDEMHAEGLVRPSPFAHHTANDFRRSA